MAGIPVTFTGPESGGDFEYHWTGEYVEAHLLSDVGRKRTHNEDNCLLCAPENPNLMKERGILFAVADGMGGVTGGEFASRLAMQTLTETYYTVPNRTVPLRLREAVERANHRIFEEAESNPAYYGMGTTVSALVLVGDCAYVAQVGDSRVYVSGSTNNIWQVTDDHSLVAEQVRNGYLSEEEARKHSLKNLITRAVGTKEDVKVDLFSFRVKQGDTFLICSDGLSNVVRDTEIGAALRTDTLQGAARVLVGRALDAGGPDNVTVVLARATKQPPRNVLEEGAVRVSRPKAGLFRRFRQWVS
jgi:protein phosphatase